MSTITIGLVIDADEEDYGATLEVVLGDAQEFFDARETEETSVILTREVTPRGSLIKLLEATEAFGEGFEIIGIGVLDLLRAAFTLGQQNPGVKLKKD